SRAAGAGGQRSFSGARFDPERLAKRSLDGSKRESRGNVGPRYCGRGRRESLSRLARCNSPGGARGGANERPRGAAASGAPAGAAAGTAIEGLVHDRIERFTAAAVQVVCAAKRSDDCSSFAATERGAGSRSGGRGRGQRAGVRVGRRRAGGKKGAQVRPRLG